MFFGFLPFGGSSYLGPETIDPNSAQCLYQPVSTPRCIVHFEIASPVYRSIIPGRAGHSYSRIALERITQNFKNRCIPVFDRPDKIIQCFTSPKIIKEEADLIRMLLVLALRRVVVAAALGSLLGLH